MAPIYDKAFAENFNDVSRYEEGKKLMKEWLMRQDWSDRTIISTEVKTTEIFKTSKGEFPFNYIMDRLDMLNTGEPEVVDYKTLIKPLQPDDVKSKIQARCYAVMAQIKYPDAPRIWVMFDMLRYDRVGAAFTREENRTMYKYMLNLMERILADDDPQEQLNENCRWCIRKAVCTKLNKHTAAGGQLGSSDPFLAMQRIYEITGQIGGLSNVLEEQMIIVQSYMDEQGVTAFQGEGLEAYVDVKSWRTVDAERVLQVVGPEIMSRYTNLGVGKLDEMMKFDTDVTPEQKVTLKQLVRKSLGEAKVKVRKKTI